MTTDAIKGLPGDPGQDDFEALESTTIEELMNDDGDDEFLDDIDDIDAELDGIININNTEAKSNVVPMPQETSASEQPVVESRKPEPVVAQKEESPSASNVAKSKGETHVEPDVKNTHNDLQPESAAENAKVEERKSRNKAQQKKPSIKHLGIAATVLMVLGGGYYFYSSSMSELYNVANERPSARALNNAESSAQFTHPLQSTTSNRREGIAQPVTQHQFNDTYQKEVELLLNNYINKEQLTEALDQYVPYIEFSELQNKMYDLNERINDIEKKQSEPSANYVARTNEIMEFMSEQDVRLSGSEAFIKSLEANIEKANSDIAKVQDENRALKNKIAKIQANERARRSNPVKSKPKAQTVAQPKKNRVAIKSSPVNLVPQEQWKLTGASKTLAFVLNITDKNEFMVRVGTIIDGCGAVTKIVPNANPALLVTERCRITGK